LINHHVAASTSILGWDRDAPAARYLNTSGRGSGTNPSRWGISRSVPKSGKSDFGGGEGAQGTLPIPLTANGTHVPIRVPDDGRRLSQGQLGGVKI
jgi:hypothetical protein